MSIKKFTPPTIEKLCQLDSLKSLVLLVVMVVATSSSFAQARFETINGLRYLIDETAKSATLVASANEKYAGDIVVPEKITAKDDKEYLVTAFGENCFKECDNLTSITIPSSITFLSDGCFCLCTNLTSVIIPSSVSSLGNDCFSFCTNLTSVIIPSSVSSLGNNCFSDCKSLTNVAIPSSVISLGDYCFWNCKSLTNVAIPSSVISLGDYCFWNCESLTNVAIPSSITTLGCGCFGFCTSLTSINIPSSVTSVGLSCFVDCSKLESIYFEGKCPSNIVNSSIPTTCIFNVLKEYLQDYKDAIGSKYPYIYAWNKDDTGGDDKPITKCEVPSIAYSSGKLSFKSPTIGAEYHYTISDTDMANDAYSQDGEVKLSAAYKISVYATAEGYQASDKATATLYWVDANLENDPSTNINQAKTRGIVVTSNGGVVTLSGLDNDEVVVFYSVDGKQLGKVKADNGTASCGVAESLIIAKVGNNTLKIAVK